MSDEYEIDPRFERRIMNAVMDRVSNSFEINKDEVKKCISADFPEALKRMKEKGIIKGGIASEDSIVIQMSDEMLSRFKDLE